MRQSSAVLESSDDSNVDDDLFDNSDVANVTGNQVASVTDAVASTITRNQVPTATDAVAASVTGNPVDTATAASVPDVTATGTATVTVADNIVTDDASDSDSNSLEETDGVKFIVEKLVDITNSSSRREEFSQKVESVGLKTLSDFKFIEIRTSFKNVLNDVELGKLEIFVKDALSERQPTHQALPKEPIKFHEIFSAAHLQKLKSSVKLTKLERRKMYQIVAYQLHLTCKPVTQKKARMAAAQLLSEFPSSLDSTNHFSVRLGSQIYNHCWHLEKLDRKRKNTVQSSGEPSAKYSKRQSVGIDPELDLPSDWPPGETVQTQLEKKNKLIEMKNSGQFSKQQVKKLSAETYVSQRATINRKLTMDKILVEWPFFGMYSVLRAHFNTLMDQDDSFTDNINELFLKLFKFFSAEANKQRRGSCKEIPINLRKALRQFDAIMDTHTPSDEFSTVIICVSLLMEQNLDHLFLHFDDTTNFAEVQASPRLPKDGKPIVAVLHPSSLLKEPKCFVLVDNTAISSEILNPIKAVLSVFWLYWVLKIEYPKQLSGTLEFIQRSIYKMDLESRVERKKKENNVWECKPPRISRRYLHLMENFSDYNNMWSGANDAE